MTRSNLVYFDRNHNDHELCRMVNQNHERRKREEAKERRFQRVQKTIAAALIAVVCLGIPLWLASL